MTRRPNQTRNLGSRALALGAVAAATIVAALAFGATQVPTDVQIPGTQPLPTDNVPTIDSVGNCNCHSFSAGTQRPESVPVFGWTGGMMANAGRDPLFWATLAIAEQDFLPGGGGVGDLCLHCHSVKGWVEGRSTPTNGSGLDPNLDAEGIMCEFCHLLTNPDQANTIPNPPEGVYHEEQNGDFVAYDEATGAGYYGGAEYVLNSGGTRLGPYADHTARHDAIPSAYHRDPRLCGTCHDVSNPAVGDLAHNHGAMSPLPGASSGDPGSPVDGKAAFNNPPETYGMVERTFSEFTASALDTWEVDDYAALPADLRVPGGALERAYNASLGGTCSVSGDACKTDANCGNGGSCVGLTADYADGAIRYFSCQTCHMSAAFGKGANQGDNRSDLPSHDQTGGSYWIPDAVRWQDANGTLRFGTGLTAGEITALEAGQARAKVQLSSAADLGATQVGNQLAVRVTNLTGHKLISGYPEGRRMWLHVEWYDASDQELTAYEAGGYGPLGVVVNDLTGDPFDVRSILDPSTTRVYEAKPAMTKEWADQLLALGYPSAMVLEWDRLTHAPGMTLGDLAATDPGTKRPTFHFVLNNDVYKDNRIPPFGMDYDETLRRNALPVPSSQFGDPGTGGRFDHWDDAPFTIPPGAVRAEIELYYQSTSWEYVQFLWLQNDGTDAFLGQEGVNMLDAWLNTGMAEPFRMAAATLTLTATSGAPGEASPQDVAGELMRADWNAATSSIDVTYVPACDATDHTIYYGDLAAVGSYAYAGQACFLGSSGLASFDPALDSVFFLVVANDGAREGSYGMSSAAGPRPEANGLAGCDYAQDLAAVTCE